MRNDFIHSLLHSRLSRIKECKQEKVRKWGGGHRDYDEMDVSNKNLLDE